jgi:hypothetical protein
MQITNITDTNYIGNPSFINDTNGWTVSNGGLAQTLSQFYIGNSSAMFTPYDTNAFMNYDLTGMTTGVYYVAQAMVLAGAGQQVYISLSGGVGAVTYIGTGQWQQLYSQPVIMNTSSFGIQVGVGFELQAIAMDYVKVSEAVSFGFDYGLCHTQIFESTQITEALTISIGGTVWYKSDFNVPNTSDSTQTAESYSIKVGSNAPFVSGSLYLLSVTDVIFTDEQYFIQPDERSDTTIYVDCVMLEQATTPGTYFDGNTGNGYHWNGAIGESTSFYRQYEVAQTTSGIEPQLGVLIAWTKQMSQFYQFFTIGVSLIGGTDFIPGTSAYPTFFNQYQWNANYSTYLLGVSIATSVGQYVYGAFGKQLNMELDNSNFMFLPNYDPIIGNYIINGRPISFQIGFNNEMLNLFCGLTTKPMNDIVNRTLTITAYDGMDYIYGFITQGQGPIAAANNGNYVNIPAHLIIGDLLEEAGFAPTQYVAEQSLQSNIGFLSPVNYQSDSGQGNDGSIGNIIADICEAEQGLFFFDESGVAHFWNREHIPTNNTVDWVFDYKSIINFQVEDTAIFNDVTVQAQPRAVQATQNIWQLTDAQLVPPATNSVVLQNIAINPNFTASTGGYFNSPFNVSASDFVTTAEYMQTVLNPRNICYVLIDSTQTTESYTVNLIQVLNYAYLRDSTATYETISVKVGTNTAYVSGFNINVNDSTKTTEALFLPNAVPYNNMPLVYSDSTQTSENYNLNVISQPRQLPYLRDSTTTYESINISTLTMVGWATNNATIMPAFGGPQGITTQCGQLSTNGTSNSYLFQQYTCTTNTQYVSQCYVQAPSSTSVTMQAVENNVILQTITITADGNWDLIQLPAFNTDILHTTFQIQIFSNLNGPILVAGVMTQLGVGALTTYYDGNTLATPNYIFSWTGTPGQSATNATPVGSLVIEADFQDENGSLPVTSVDLPIYNNTNLDSSYLTNLNADNTGLPQNTNIILQEVSLSGSTYLMTFVNTYTQPIYITSINLYGTPAKVTHSINVPYTNPTSIVLYGDNPTNNGQTLLISNDLIQDPSTALSDAYSLVNDYSSPYTRIVADVFPAYQLQIGDLCQITINDTGITGNYTVVGITNGIGANGEPQQTLELEIKQLVHYFTINTSVIGGTDSIAP